MSWAWFGGDAEAAQSTDPNATVTGLATIQATTTIGAPDVLGLLIVENFDDTDGTTVTTGNSVFDTISGSGSSTYENSPTPVSGATLMDVDGTGGSRSHKDTNTLPGAANGGTAKTKLTQRVYFEMLALPSTATRILLFETSGAADVATLRVQTNGSLRMGDAGVFPGSGTTLQMSPGTRYRIEYYVDQDANEQTLDIWWGADLHSTDTGATNHEQLVQALTSDLAIEAAGVGVFNTPGTHFYFDSWAVGTNRLLGPDPEAPALVSAATIAAVATVGSPTLPVYPATIQATATVGAPTVPVMATTIQATARVGKPFPPATAPTFFTNASRTSSLNQTNCDTGSFTSTVGSTYITFFLLTDSDGVDAPTSVVFSGSDPPLITEIPNTTVEGNTIAAPTFRVSAWQWVGDGVSRTLTFNHADAGTGWTVYTVEIGPGPYRVVQAATGRADSGTTMAVSLGAFADPSNETLIFVASSTPTSGIAVNGTGAYTELTEVATTSPTQRVSSAYRLSADTAPSMINPTSDDWVAVAVELESVFAVQAGSVVSPTAIVAVATVGTATPVVDASVTAVTVAAVATVGAPTVQVESDATATPDTVQAVATIGTPTLAAGSVETGVTVQATTTVGAPTLAAGVGITATTVQATTTVGAPTLRVVDEPTTIAVTTTVGSPTVAAESVETATTISAITTVAGQWTFSDDFERADAGDGTLGNGWKNLPSDPEFPEPSVIVDGQAYTQDAYRPIPGSRVYTLSYTMGAVGTFPVDLSFIFTGGGEYGIEDRGEADNRIDIDIFAPPGFDNAFQHIEDAHLDAGDFVEVEIDLDSHIKVWVNGVLIGELSNSIFYDGTPAFPYPSGPTSEVWLEEGGLDGYSYEDFSVRHGRRDGSDGTIVTAGSVVTPATIAVTATVGSPTIDAESEAVVTPDTVQAVTTVGSPTLAAGSAHTATAVQATATVGAPTIAAGSLHAATAVQATTTVGAPTLAAGSLVSPSTVQAVATVGAPTLPKSVATIQVTATVSAPTLQVADEPTTVQAVATVGSPTLVAGSLHTATSVSAVTTVGAPTLAAGVGITATVVQATTTVGAPALPKHVDTVQAVATVGAPTIAAGAVITATAVQAVTSVGAPTLAAGSVHTATAVQATATVGAPTLAAGSVHTATTVQAVTTVGAPTLPKHVDTVQAVATVGAPTLAAGSVVAPSSISVVATVGAPTFSVADEPETIQVVATVGAPTLAAGSVVTTTSVSAVATVGSPAISAGSDVTAAPDTVHAVATVGSPTLAAGSVHTATVVAAVATVGAPTFIVIDEPAAINVVTSIGAPTIAAGSLHAATAVQAVATVGSPTLAAGSLVAATAIPAVATVGAPTLAAGALVTAATVAAVTTVGSPSIEAQDSVTVTPNTIHAVTTIGAPSFIAGALHAATAIGAVASVGTPTLRVVDEPTTVHATVTVGVPTLAAGSTVLATAIQLATTLAAPSIESESNATVTPSVILAVATVGDETVLTVSVVTPATIGAAATVGDPSIYAELHAAVLAETIQAVTTIGGHQLRVSVRRGSPWKSRPNNPSTQADTRSGTSESRVRAGSHSSSVSALPLHSRLGTGPTHSEVT